MSFVVGMVAALFIYIAADWIRLKRKKEMKHDSL